MSDLFSRNNTYFTASIYNSDPINDTLANFDVSQVSALVPKASDWQIAIDKARLPLNIPLTPYNIPFRQYGVILKGETSGGTPVQSIDTFVGQIGATSNNFLYNVDPATGTFSAYNYNEAGALTLLSSYNIPNTIAVSYGPMVVDGYQNLYLACSNFVSDSYDTLAIFSYGGTFLTSLSFTSIKALAIAPTQSIYVANESSVSSVIKYTNVNSPTSVSLTLAGTILNNFAGSPLVDIQTVCVDSQVLVTYNGNNLSIYDTTLIPVSDTLLTNITAPVSSAIITDQNRFVMVDDGSGPDLIYGKNGTNIINGLNGAVMQATTGFSSAPFFQGDGSQPTALAFGPSNTSFTDVATFNNTSTPTITGESEANGSTTVNQIFPHTNQENFMSFVSGGSNLFCWDLNNISNNVYQNVNSAFEVSGSVTVSHAGMQITDFSPLFVVGSDNNLYQTSTNFFPRNIISSFGGAIEKYGGGWNTQGVQTGQGEMFQSVIPTVVGPNTPYCGGVYKSGNTLYSIFQDITNPTGNNLYFVQLNSETLTVNSTVELTVQTQLSGTSPIQLAQINSTSYAVLSPDVTTPTTTNINLFLLAGTSPYYTFIYSANAQYICTLSSGGVDYLFILDSGTNIMQVYDATSGTPTLLGAVFAAGLPSLGHCVAFVNGTYPFPTILYTSGDNIVYLQMVVVGTPSIFASGIAITSSAFSPNSPISYNSALSEAYVKGSINNSTIVNVAYNVPPSTITGTYTYAGAAGLLSSPFIYSTSDVSYEYIFTQVPYSLPSSGHITSLTFSKVDPNTIYMLNSADSKVYVGELAGGSITQIRLHNPTSANTFTSIGAYPNNNVVNYIAYLFSLSTQAQIATYSSPTAITSVGRNPLAFSGVGEFTFGINKTSLVSLSPSDFSSQFVSPLSTIGSIFTADGAETSAGNVNIWTYSTLIDQINIALSYAWSDVVAKGATLQQAPSISLNYQTGLATLSFSSDYSAAGNAILFNNGLLQILYFDSTPDIANANFNDITIPNISPSLTSITQTVLSLWQFNQLDKILFISNSLFTLFPNSFANSNSLNVVADFDVTTQDVGFMMNNISNVLYIAPFIYNPIVMASNDPVVRVQLQIWYQLLDGTLYPLYVPPLQNVTMKLILARRF